MKMMDRRTVSIFTLLLLFIASPSLKVFAQEYDEFDGPDYSGGTTASKSTQKTWIAQALAIEDDEVKVAPRTDETQSTASETKTSEDEVVYYYLPTNGFYFSLGGRFELPVIVGDFGAITGVGGGGSAELGFHLASDWRFGLRYVFAMNVPGSDSLATDISMMHNMATVQIAKEFDASLIDAFPMWLIITPSLGAGVDFISGNGVYTTSGEAYTFGGPAFVANAGLALEIDTMTIAVPYVGATVDLYFDESGVVPYTGISVGIRLDWGRIRSVEDYVDAEESAETGDAQ